MASSPPTSAGALVGAVVSRRWRLGARLGEGGMGEVYGADPIDGGPRVAVKILRREFLASRDVLTRFLDEARMCMRLVHPNIVRVLQCAQAEDGSPYLVMELLEGVSLGAYMRHGARVPLARAAPIVQGILSGLACAHANGIVHRDLKPDNVFLSRDAKGGFGVKVLDFGIAKVMDAAGGMGTRTRTGMLLGTPAYMSPEQARNARDVDPRADLWSAGVLFYEMLTGRVAFPAPTEYARRAALLSSEPEPIEKIDPALATLSPFLQRALKKNRDERFATAVEMAQALASLVPSATLRSDPSIGEPAEAGAFSRLPDVASVLVAAPGSLRASPSPTSPPVLGTPSPARGSGVKPRAPGATLASADAQRATIESSPAVVAIAASPLDGTMPSKDGSGYIRAHLRRGIPLQLVVLVAACTFAVGFLLGWSLGRWRVP
ncbi:MAG: serine/threonine-protein kinase [Polyangiaceae bacterium]|jgi:serine/threonine-protein kinase